jgi:hypothetical protein
MSMAWHLMEALGLIEGREYLLAGTAGFVASALVNRG